VPVNILNLSGLDVVDFRETDTEYHVRAMPKAISRLCPHCGRSNDTVVHAKRTLVIRDIPSHGKAVVIHLDVPRLKCRPCIQTFTASVPEVDTGREMTERLAKWIGRQSIEYTYAEIAKQVKVDEKTVRTSLTSTWRYWPMSISVKHLCGLVSMKSSSSASELFSRTCTADRSSICCQTGPHFFWVQAS
jgi:transposase